MKTNIFILLVALSVTIFILPGCYTQLSYRDRDYRWRGYDRDYDESRDQAANVDSVNDNDSTYADDNAEVNNFYYEGFASPSWHFRYYHPSYGFSLAYGDLYDPFWGDPWWGCTPWYSPFAFYTPWWGYSEGWGYHGSYWGNHHGLWAYNRPVGRGYLRNEGGFGRSLSGRNLVRLSTTTRERQVMPGINRRSTVAEANLNRTRNASAFTRTRNGVTGASRSIISSRPQNVPSEGRSGITSQRSRVAASGNQGRRNTIFDNRAASVRKSGSGRGQAVNGSRPRSNSGRSGQAQRQPSQRVSSSRPSGGSHSSAPAPSRSGNGGGQRSGNDSGRRR